MTNQIEEFVVAIEAAAEAVVYLPVQRQNMVGQQMSPDTMAALPVPVWERLCEVAERALVQSDGLVAARSFPRDQPSRSAATRRFAEWFVKNHGVPNE